MSKAAERFRRSSAVEQLAMSEKNNFERVEEQLERMKLTISRLKILHELMRGEMQQKTISNNMVS